MTNIFIILAFFLTFAVLFWLRYDMIRQRKWREQKELKIAQTKRRIADKEKAAIATARKDEA